LDDDSAGMEKDKDRVSTSTDNAIR
jgi:hypothetical protein